MLIHKIAPVFFLALCVWADKKIELQDIEEDNLKSEKEKDYDGAEPRFQTSGSERDLIPLEFLKNGLLKYFEQNKSQQPRVVQQYAVNEPPEKLSQQHVYDKSQFPSGPSAPSGPSGPATQQAMVGYLSNVPMQIYLVPQYYNDHSEQASNSQPGIQYAAPSPHGYTHESPQQQTNYIQVPSYITPTGKPYMPQYAPQVTYVTYAPQPHIAPTSPHMAVVSSGSVPSGPQSISPYVTYQMPLVQYHSQVNPKGYYHTPQFADTNTVEENQESEIESPKQYASQTEAPNTKPSGLEYPRYYTSRNPIRDDYKYAPQDLPPPNPLLLRSQPPHLSHIPKALPMYRPFRKPVYVPPPGVVSNLTPRPPDGYGPPTYKKRPTSLLDSYIPSGVQLEYLKRGFTKDPLMAYEALASGRSLQSYPVTPRQYERGFLPNQMYHTAAGGVTFGHYKRTPKPDLQSQHT